MRKKCMVISAVLCFFLCAAAIANGSDDIDSNTLKVTITGTVRLERSLPVVTVGSKTYTLVGIVMQPQGKRQHDGQNAPALGPFGGGSDAPPFDPPPGKAEKMPLPVTSDEIRLLVGKRASLTGFLPEAKDGGLYFVVLSYEIK